MTNTAISKRPLRQVQDVKQLLQNEQAREQLAAVAARHMNPERLMRVTANAIRTTPKLQECEPLSFLGALMQCAALGLEPNTVLGHAYLIPFDKSVKDEKGRWQKIPQVQLIIGYKGLIDLARRSGHITSISANIHYSDDEMWEYEEGTEARLRHVPGAQDGEPLHAYAIARFTEGGHAYVVLPWAQVMKIRDGSQGWQAAVKYGKIEGSPWHTHEAAMAKKTAIRALSKYLPLSVEFMDAVQADHDSGARIDYAAYAKNPDRGPMIEGDAIEVDGENAEDSKEETSEKADEKRPETEVETKADKAEKEALQEKPKNEERAPEPSQFKALYDMILADFMDADNVDDVVDLYAPQIEQMKQSAPGLHADLEKEIATYRDGAGK